jgi:cardiolipin synthase
MRRVFYEDWTLAGGRAEAPRMEDLPDPGDAPAGNLPIRVLPAGLDELTDDIATVLCAAFRSARHSILIVTPYFVPEPRSYDALRLAALSGVDVRGLLRAGVRIWLRPSPFLHSKAIVVDDAWATVGSVNFDARSMELNFELNLEIVDRAFAKTLRSYFDRDFEVATELDAARFAQPPALSRRLLENVASLFAPIL